MTRRSFLQQAALATGAAAVSAEGASASKKAAVAITFDLEMSRNFPTWEQTGWDYEKGNLDEATKHYAAEAAARVKARGGRMHFFVVGRTLEQENVDWLRALLADGHRLGNHTYDHVNITAQRPQDIQFRFQRAPWLIAGHTPAEVIRENIRLCSEAMKSRLGAEPVGFRTPGGFGDGLAASPDRRRILLDLGFTWCSAKYPRAASIKADTEPDSATFDSIVAAQADAQPFRYPDGLLEIPMSPVSDIGAFRTGRWKLDSFLTAIRLGLEWAIEHRAVYDFLSHPSCLGVIDPHFRALDLILDLVTNNASAAELRTLDEIAAAAV